MRIERLEAKLMGWVKGQAAAPPSPAGLAGLLLILAALGAAQYFSPGALRFAPLYLLPVGLAALRFNKTLGYLTAILSALTLEAADLLADKQAMQYAYSCLNILLHSLVFMIFALLAHTIQRAHASQQSTARVDSLTGQFNLRAFGEYLTNEIERCRRFKHPFSVAYVGWAEFGAARQGLGPAQADGILRLMAEGIRSSLRNTDVVARVADDEFAMLLAGSDAQAACLAMDKVRGRLHEIITRHYPELKPSIGVLTFSQCPYSFREVLDMAEMAMYQARAAGPDAVQD